RIAYVENDGADPQRGSLERGARRIKAPAATTSAPNTPAAPAKANVSDRWLSPRSAPPLGGSISGRGNGGPSRIVTASGCPFRIVTRLTGRDCTGQASPT